VSIPDVAEEFDADQAGPDIRPSYNIPPGQDIAVILDDSKRRIVMCRWGFIPTWSKDPSIGNRMINARAETVWEKPAFRGVFRKQRCLIAANGFYEWRKDGKVKTPVYIRLKSRNTFGFAGLYNTWKSPEGNELCTTTIITTEANKMLDAVHNRMPVIIPREKEAVWLNQGLHDKEVLIPVMVPYPTEDMELTEVSSIVNSPTNDSPDCIKPV
jgi:putative SOS response-associated peptidase YedK